MGMDDVDWVQKSCNKAFEKDLVPEDCKTADCGERTECSNFRGNSWLSIVGEIYAGDSD